MKEAHITIERQSEGFVVAVNGCGIGDGYVMSTWQFALRAAMHCAVGAMSLGVVPSLNGFVVPEGSRTAELSKSGAAFYDVDGTLIRCVWRQESGEPRLPFPIDLGDAL